jgi:hypothetical protein
MNVTVQQQPGRHDSGSNHRCVCLDRLYVECGGLAITAVLWVQHQGEFLVAGWLALTLAWVNTQCRAKRLEYTWL